MVKNPTAQDYKKEMQDLLRKVEKLQQIIVTRLYTLCAQYPSVVVARKDGTEIMAKSLIINGKDFINCIELEEQIQYIATIEKWLADQHPHKQLNIEYPKDAYVLDRK